MLYFLFDYYRYYFFATVVDFLANVRVHLAAAVGKLLPLFLFLAPTFSFAELPPNAKLYYPVLLEVSSQVWPEFKYPWLFGGQVEQETCISLKSKGCWNPNTQFKTDREWGFGLGQITTTKNMNMFEEIKRIDKSRLGSWKIKDWRDPRNQLIALVDLNKLNYDRIRYPTSNETEKLAFMFSTYNGGSCLKDVKLCSTISGCDPTKWFSNVEKHSFKQKIKVTGYGKSFFDINREYVRNIITIRSEKYK